MVMNSDRNTAQLLLRGSPGSRGRCKVGLVCIVTCPGGLQQLVATMRGLNARSYGGGNEEGEQGGDEKILKMRRETET